MDFFAVIFVVDRESRRVELIIIPNCSLMHLHSNNRNSLKSLSLKKVIAINIIVIKNTQIKSKCNGLREHITCLYI